MPSTLTALIGVLVGAAIATATTWYFERRRERRAFRVAARLVREDVVDAGASVETLLRRGWFSGLKLETAGWDQHRSALAGELTEDQWNEVAEAMSAVRRVQIMVGALVELQNGDLDPQNIPSDGRDIAEQTIRRLREARELLSGFA